MQYSSAFTASSLTTRKTALRNESDFFLMSRIPTGKKMGIKKRGQEKRQYKSPVEVTGYFIALSCKTAAPQFLMR